MFFIGRDTVQSVLQVCMLEGIFVLLLLTILYSL